MKNKEKDSVPVTGMQCDRDSTRKTRGLLVKQGTSKLSLGSFKRFTQFDYDVNMRVEDGTLGLVCLDADPDNLYYDNRLIFQDGMAWTGFVSEAADGNGGYALVFRELNGNAAHSFDLAGIFGGDATLSVEVIGGRGKASFDKGVLSVEIPARLDFLWVKMSSPQCRR